jgi:hypothetical protein
MIPYMLRVMELCAHASDRQPISDYQFLDRASDDDDRDAGEALLHGVAHALRTVGTAAPDDRAPRPSMATMTGPGWPSLSASYERIASTACRSSVHTALRTSSLSV